MGFIELTSRYGTHAELERFISFKRGEIAANRASCPAVILAREFANEGREELYAIMRDEPMLELEDRPLFPNPEFFKKFVDPDQLADTYVNYGGVIMSAAIVGLEDTLAYAEFDPTSFAPYITMLLGELLFLTF